MLLSELDRYFRNLMDIDDMASVDNALNGIQVDRRAKEIDKIVFAVDASMETFRRAVDFGADLVFVHHGIFWGVQLAIRGSRYERLQFLINNDIALYAVHLPLDMQHDFGNNYAMAKVIGLEDLCPFGLYHGVQIGVSGELKEPKKIDQIIGALGIDRGAMTLLPFGKEMIESVAIVSGDGISVFDQAVDLGVDLYITGESSHTIYHTSLEEGLNVISGGHYQTEIWGVSRLAEKTREDTGVDTRFIDVPTGL